MQLDRRQFALTLLALGLLSTPPAFAGADEDAVLKNVEAFRVAQAAGNADAIAPLLAEDLSYSHSNGAVDDKAKLLSGIANANYRWTSLEYKNPTVKVVGTAAIVRFTFVGEQEFADGDYVMHRGYTTATHKGEFQGIAPTGKQVKLNTLDIWRVENGKAVENWVQMDLLGLMQQIGAIPAPQHTES